MDKRKTLTATHLVTLMDKVRQAEGWTWKEGESRSYRVVQAYSVKPDHQRNRWVATPRPASA